MMEAEEFDVEAEIAARDNAIVELTLACFSYKSQVKEMAQTIRELMVDKHIDEVVH